MKKQKVFILIASLVTSYASLEASFHKEMLIARLDAKGQSIHMQELARKQEAEKQKQCEIERAEKQRIAARKQRRADRLKKQDIQEQKNLIQNLETVEDIFDSTSVSEEE